MFTTKNINNVSEFMELVAELFDEDMDRMEIHYVNDKWEVLFDTTPFNAEILSTQKFSPIYEIVPLEINMRYDAPSYTSLGGWRPHGTTKVSVVLDMAKITKFDLHKARVLAKLYKE